MSMKLLFMGILLMGTSLVTAIRQDAFAPHADKGIADACTYKVYIKTKDVEGAGTDANVGVTFFNNFGEKVELLNLDDPKRNDFERGNTDDFTKENKCILVCGMAIYSDGSGKDSAWTIEFVRLEQSWGDMFWPVNQELKVDGDLSYTIPCQQY